MKQSSGEWFARVSCTAIGGGGNTCAGDAMRSGQHGCVVEGSVMTRSNCLKLIFFNIISIMIIICNKWFCKTVFFRPLLHGCAYFVFLKHLFRIWFSQSACIYWRTKVNVICTRQTCKNTEALCCSVGFVSTRGHTTCTRLPAAELYESEPEQRPRTDSVIWGNTWIFEIVCFRQSHAHRRSWSSVRVTVLLAGLHVVCGLGLNIIFGDKVLFQLLD